MHVEHLDWLANNSRYTQRFALQVGKLCRDMPNKAVAEMERLHHSTVKELDKLYMQEQVERAGLPAPRAIGIDEISIRKGHNYRVIVSDLERARPIWVGGEGRKQVDIDLFFKALGEKKSARIKLAAMDMWKPFRNSVINPNRKIFEARKRETAALGAGEKLVLGHPLAATIGDSARCMQNLEKVLFTGPKTSDTVTFICD